MYPSSSSFPPHPASLLPSLSPYVHFFLQFLFCASLQCSVSLLFCRDSIHTLSGELLFPPKTSVPTFRLMLPVCNSSLHQCPGFKSCDSSHLLNISSWKSHRHIYTLTSKFALFPKLSVTIQQVTLEMWGLLWPFLRPWEAVVTNRKRHYGSPSLGLFNSLLSTA